MVFSLFLVGGLPLLRISEEEGGAVLVFAKIGDDLLPLSRVGEPLHVDHCVRVVQVQAFSGSFVAMIIPILIW